MGVLDSLRRTFGLDLPAGRPPPTVLPARYRAGPPPPEPDPGPRAFAPFPGPPAADAFPAAGEAPGYPPGSVVDPEPEQEYVTAAGGMLSRIASSGLMSQSIDDVTRQFGGDTIYELVDTDPAAGAGVITLERAVLSGSFQVSANREYRLKPGTDVTQATPEQALAQEIADFVARMLTNMEEPAEDVTRQLFKAARLGSMIGEIVLALGDEDGPDSLRYVVKKVKVKPRRSWSFWCDQFLNVLGFLVTTPDGRRVLPRWKFLLWSWMPTDGDPRGTSIYRRAFQFFQLKVQTVPEYLNFLIRFATPFLLGICAPRAVPRPGESPTGAPVAGARDVSPEKRMADTLKAARGSMSMAIPNGADVKALEAKSQGEPHRTALDACDRQILLAILCETRSAVEAKHGSKADSETALDVLIMIVGTLKGIVCRLWTWQVVYPLLILNWGKAIADRMCPDLSLGGVQHQNLAPLLTALGSVAYKLSPSQLPYWDVFVNPDVPARSEEEAADALAPPPAPNPTPPPQPPGAGPAEEGEPPKKSARRFARRPRRREFSTGPTTG